MSTDAYSSPDGCLWGDRVSRRHDSNPGAPRMSSRQSRDVDAALGTLAGIATALRDPATAAEADAVRRRVEHDRFVVACVGQFKRGKSTLINALIGDPVLPAGIVPVTAITTVV